MAEVGCAKTASANMEVVFSGVGSISTKSHRLDPQLLSDYWKGEWLAEGLTDCKHLKGGGVLSPRCSGGAVCIINIPVTTPYPLHLTL